MKKIFVLKQLLKSLATEIRKAKADYKEYQRLHNGCSDGHIGKLYELRYEFRHKHFAYCLLRGTDRVKIETPSKDQVKKPYVQPDEMYIQEVIHEYSETQDVRACA